MSRLTEIEEAAKYKLRNCRPGTKTDETTQLIELCSLLRQAEAALKFYADDLVK